VDDKGEERTKGNAAYRFRNGSLLQPSIPPAWPRSGGATIGRHAEVQIGLAHYGDGRGGRLMTSDLVVLYSILVESESHSRSLRDLDFTVPEGIELLLVQNFDRWRPLLLRKKRWSSQRQFF
jgi:hypothetical protein